MFVRHMCDAVPSYIRRTDAGDTPLLTRIRLLRCVDARLTTADMELCGRA